MPTGTRQAARSRWRVERTEAVNPEVMIEGAPEGDAVASVSLDLPVGEGQAQPQDEATIPPNFPMPPAEASGEQRVTEQGEATMPPEGAVPVATPETGFVEPCTQRESLLVDYAASHRPPGLRAGLGPLSSLVMPSTRGSPAGAPVRDSCGAGSAAGEGFVPLDRPGGLAVVMLAGLVAAASYAVYRDFSSLGPLATLRERNNEIRLYNRSRNVLVEQLARSKSDRLANLRDYAAWVDKQQEKGVIVYVPGDDGEPVRTVVGKADLSDLRRKVDQDIRNAERWTPPDLMQGYDDLEFGTGELVLSRGPVAVTFVLAMLALVLWSHRAYRNLPFLGIDTTAFRPSMVPLYWFVPIGNLLLPCAVMGEIWHGSDPRKLQRPSALRLPVIGLWWPLLLATTGLVALAAFRMAAARGIEQMVQTTRFAVYGDAGMGFVGVLTLALVAAASWNQSRRRKLVSKVEAELGRPADWRTGYVTSFT